MSQKLRRPTPQMQEVLDRLKGGGKLKMVGQTGLFFDDYSVVAIPTMRGLFERGLIEKDGHGFIRLVEPEAK